MKQLTPFARQLLIDMDRDARRRAQKAARHARWRAWLRRSWDHALLALIALASLAAFIGSVWQIAGLK